MSCPDEDRLAVSDVFDPQTDRLLSIDLNARAYGWEIGRGAEMVDTLVSSPDNPFLDPDWRDHKKELNA